MKAIALRQADRAWNLDPSACKDGRIVTGLGVTGSIGSAAWTPKSETWSVHESPDHSR